MSGAYLDVRTKSLAQPAQRANTCGDVSNRQTGVDRAPDGIGRNAIRVVFRYDDCSARSSLDLETRLAEAFGKHGAQLTVGVIPFVCERFESTAPQSSTRLSNAKAALLRRAAERGQIDIALHGYNHQAWRDNDTSEFRGLPYIEQLKRLHLGKQELEQRLNVRVRTFIPPWNRYDEATLTALEAEGLECLSASLIGPFSKTASGVRLLPDSCWLRGLHHAVRYATPLRRLAPVIVVTLHDFDFFESGHRDAWMSVNDLESHLAVLARAQHVRLRSIGQADLEGFSFVGDPFRVQRLWSRATRGRSWRVRELLQQQILWRRLGRSRLLAAFLQSYVVIRRVGDEIPPVARRRIRGLAAR